MTIDVDIEQRSIRVALYVRASGQCFAEQALSYCAQHQAAGQFIQQHTGEGWVLIEEDFTDQGSSLAASKPGWDKLMQQIRDGRVDIVVVCDLARISRATGALMTILGEFGLLGVQLCKVGERPMELTDSFQSKFLHALAALEGQFHGNPAAST